MIKKIIPLFLTFAFIFLDFYLASYTLAQEKIVPEGRGMWVWRVEYDSEFFNNINLAISKLKSAGITWVAVKAGDGDSLWVNSNVPWLVSNIGILHSAGIKVYGWQYVYGNDDRWGIENVSEADVANQILNIPGIDGLIIDAEAEYRDALDNKIKAEMYMQNIRQAHPNVFIGYTPLAFPYYHSNFPYLEFSKYCDAVLPQAYWVNRGVYPNNTPSYELTRLKQQWDALYAQWQSDPNYNQWVSEGKNPIKPIYPVISLNNVPVEQVGEFFTILPNFGYQNPSFWRYGVVSDLVWDCLFGGSCTASSSPPSPPPPPPPPPPAAATQASKRNNNKSVVRWETKCTRTRRGKKICKKYRVKYITTAKWFTRCTRDRKRIKVCRRYKTFVTRKIYL